MKYTEEYWNDVEEVIHCIPNYKELFHKTVFITGGTGMICSAAVEILDLLNRKYDADIRIIIAVRSEQEIENRFPGWIEKKAVEYFHYDATSQEPLNFEADYIIHAASNANPALYTKEPVETMLSNIVGLHMLFQNAVKNGVKRVLYFSSSEVYGKIDEVRPFREDDYGFIDILNPRACYPNSKRAAETLCASYAQEYNIDAVIVRPGHIYGPTIAPWDTRASAQFSRSAANGEDIVMKSAGLQLRSYMYTLDCASAILTVLLNGESENAYNISNPDSVINIRCMAEILARSAGVKLKMELPTEAEKKGFNPMSNSSLDSRELLALGWKGLFDAERGFSHTVDILKQMD